jgi:hypothetical protein
MRGAQLVRQIGALIAAPSPLAGEGDRSGRQDTGWVRGYGLSIDRNPSPGVIVCQMHVGPLPQGERAQQAAPRDESWKEPP